MKFFDLFYGTLIRWFIIIIIIIIIISIDDLYIGNISGVGWKFCM
jgi:hypothetical protein